jgi:hypothetical protein
MTIRISRTAVDHAEEIAAEAETDFDNARGRTARTVRGAIAASTATNYVVKRTVYRLAGGTDR